MAPELIAIFAFGVVFVGTLLLLSIRFPNPTDFQYLVFRIVLALASAGVAALMPGLLEVEFQTWLKAGGALAVFVIVYFKSPANMVAQGIHINTGIRKELFDAWKGMRALAAGDYNQEQAATAINTLNLTSNIWSTNKNVQKWIANEYWNSYSALYEVLRDYPITIVHEGKTTKELTDNQIALTYYEMKSIHQHANKGATNGKSRAN